ncbi:hypothetical protein [Klebsiella electrica]|uniref:hypothetical protein n=1 Tax=Klebsiella electrica TaxID=1259973 RepID=UPI0010354EF7|nr:hypothetical protein [Klebsiella electrica]
MDTGQRHDCFVEEYDCKSGQPFYQIAPATFPNLIEDDAKAEAVAHLLASLSLKLIARVTSLTALTQRL